MRFKCLHCDKTYAGKWSKAILAVDENHVEAISIYRRLGFEFVETTDEYYGKGTKAKAMMKSR